VNISVAENMHLAVGAVWTHRFRSLLTILGIVIGITTVVTVASLLTGLRQGVVTFFQQLGPDNIFLFKSSGDPNMDPPLKERKRRAMKPEYAEYLKRCGVVGFKAIASREDQEVYEAVRHLSVVKEDPASSPADVRQAESRLLEARDSRSFVSESTKSSRLYWWTAEYGLVGSLDHPRLYGAGLLSSILESGHCLTSAVVKLPFSLACVDQDFDITRMQPKLFVARDFDHLFEVLEGFEATLAWKRGGDYGLEQARRARTVNHLMLDGGLELTGQVERWIPGPPRAKGLSALLAVLAGPVMVSRDGLSLQHAPYAGSALVVFGPARPLPNGSFTLDLADGLRLTGTRVGEEQEVRELRGSRHGQPLELPGAAMLLLSEGLRGVAGGLFVGDGRARGFCGHRGTCLSAADLGRGGGNGGSGHLRFGRDRGRSSARRGSGLRCGSRSRSEAMLVFPLGDRRGLCR